MKIYTQKTHIICEIETEDESYLFYNNFRKIKLIINKPNSGHSTQYEYYPQGICILNFVVWGRMGNYTGYPSKICFTKRAFSKLTVVQLMALNLTNFQAKVLGANI